VTYWEGQGVGREGGGLDPGGVMFRSVRGELPHDFLLWREEAENTSHVVYFHSDVRFEELASIRRELNQLGIG
jgi:hypothetical protein